MGDESGGARAPKASRTEATRIALELTQQPTITRIRKEPRTATPRCERPEASIHRQVAGHLMATEFKAGEPPSAVVPAQSMATM
jgi:hypothetical protein